MRTTKKTELQKEKIIQRIEKNLGKKILGYELAELRGTIEAVNKIGIYPKSGLGTAWGLILFCQSESAKQDIYFYYPATEGMFDFFFRQNSGDAPAEDQFILLNTLQNLTFETPKKSFFSFLNPDEKRTIFVSAKTAEEEIKFCFMLMENRAEEVAEKLRQ